MTDEADDPVVDEPQTEEPEQQAADWRERVDWESIEEKAREHGWKPDGVEGKDFVDPVTFVARFEGINATKQQTKKHERQLKQLTDTTSKLLRQAEERAYNEAKAELESQHRRAVDEGDHNTARQAAEQMATLKKPDPEAERAQRNAEVVNEWVSQNQWFMQDELKAAAAKQLYSERVQQLGYDDAEEILPWVEQKVQAQQADSPPPRQTAPVVESGKRSTRKGGQRWTAASITDHATKQMGRLLVQQGHYKSLDAFAQELGESGGLE